MKFIVLLVVLASMASGEEGQGGYNRHSELLKPEKNTIDHGPKTHKSGHLLGYKGEHWAMLKKKKKNNYKKKATHSLDGSHHDNLDDIRLQDLSFNSKHSSAHEAFIKERKAKKEKYLKKLEHYKAKMMGKKKYNKKDHREKAHHKKTHRNKSTHSKLP